MFSKLLINSIETIKNRFIKNCHILQINGFKVPSVIHSGNNGKNDYIFTKGLNSISLVDYLNKLKYEKGKNNQKKIRSVIKITAELIGKMHKKGIIHGDLRAGNILMEIEDDKYDLYFIDNERNTLHKNIPQKYLIKNLNQINMQPGDLLTFTDRMFFYKHYLSAFNGIKKEEIKKIAYRVHIITKKRMREKYG